MWLQENVLESSLNKIANTTASTSTPSPLGQDTNNRYKVKTLPHQTMRKTYEQDCP